MASSEAKEEKASEENETNKDEQDEDEENEEEEYEEDEYEDDEERQYIKKARELTFIPTREEIQQQNIDKPPPSKAHTITKGELRRRYNRRARDLMKSGEVSNLEYISNLTSNWFINPELITIFKFILISIYGTYSLMAFLVMIFYILDYNDYVFDEQIIENAGAIMVIFLMFSWTLSIIGCFATFKIGHITEKGYDLADVYYELSGNRAECEEISNFMVDDGSSFLIENGQFIQNQDEIKYEMHKLLAKMTALGRAIRQFANAEAGGGKGGRGGRGGKGKPNPELIKIVHYIQASYQDIYLHFVAMRMTVDRSKALQLFYKYQLKGDKKNGLNQQEFERLLTTLDQEVPDEDDVHQHVYEFNASDFDSFDKNLDGNIDILEFEHTINELYITKMKELRDKYYQNRSPEKKAWDKEQKAREMEHEKDQQQLEALFANSKRFGSTKRLSSRSIQF